MSYEIRYGKAEVAVYRTHASPLRHVAAIPESPFTARDNTLFGVELEIVVRGEQFLPAYTQGDNRRVVATDTMKNFIVERALGCQAATLEGGLKIPGGAIDAITALSDEVRVDVAKLAKVDLPALSRPPEYDVARPVGSKP